ncbi:MAG TPA: undecaprenyldiphospho-muramoylpentapeptide beta-N-acetylglucosaminyltransferase [Candidatus Acidoferrales bacterium]|nr:undecaprenyldiphospho-muramoylpentapeptide beta-N-acetylglucosaminyltransferase [Candidatus Acidoferrales bacterium]
MGVKLLIAGGGTGGHVFPAMAIAREWLSRGTEREVVLVGTTRGIEMKLVPQAGLPLETLRVAGLKGKGGGTLLKNLFKLAPAMLDASRVVKKHKPIGAFGVGGYAAGPMLLTTWMHGIPNVIFEPNAEPGFTNKSLARISARIATGYEISARTWGEKAVVTGCPVRPEFLTIAQRIPQKPLRVLITGGSQGALPVNRAFVDAMDFLATRKNEMTIVHQTGERDYDAVRTAYARREILAEVVPFLSNMPERFAWADIIVCRAGAITAAEVAAAGRAAIFIPFGRATDSHQLRNAQEMARQHAGRVITEAELTGERLTKEIFALLDSPEQIERMSMAARRLSWPNATRDIVNLIEQAAGIAPSPGKVRAAAGSSTVSTSAVSTPDREKVAP